jgi:hypothetical protein
VKARRDREGYILPAVRFVLKSLHNITLIGIIECVKKKKTTSRKTLDIFTLSSLISLSIFIIIINYSDLTGIKYIFSILASWRLFSIIVTTIRLSFFRPEDSPHPIPERSLTLLAINYVEIIFIFSILFFSFDHTLPNICASLNLSFRVFVPIMPKEGLTTIYWLLVLEIIISLIIHVTIIQRALSYFKRN